jgi:hypothetical protein
MFGRNNESLGRLFLLITGVGIIHMGEQLVVGIEEYYVLRGQVERWHALFPPALQGHASVILVTVVFVFVSMMIYAALRGGAAGTAVVLLFGVLGVGEAHHWIQAVAESRYDPGLITSVPFVFVGALIVREAVAELRRGTRRTPEPAL